MKIQFIKVAKYITEELKLLYGVFCFYRMFYEWNRFGLLLLSRTVFILHSGSFISLYYVPCSPLYHICTDAWCNAHITRCCGIPLADCTIPVFIISRNQFVACVYLSTWRFLRFSGKLFISFFYVSSIIIYRCTSAHIFI